MAGHSHWAGIKHKKGKADKQRSKIFSKLFPKIFLKPHDSAIYLPVLRTSDWIAQKPAEGGQRKVATIHSHTRST